MALGMAGKEGLEENNKMDKGIIYFCFYGKILLYNKIKMLWVCCLGFGSRKLRI